MRRLNVLLALTLGAALTAQGGTGRGPVLIVVNQDDATISLINPASGQTLTTVHDRLAGMHGHEAAASSDGSTAYVPVYSNVGVGQKGLDGDTVLAVDIPSGKIKSQIRFDHPVRPHDAVFDASHQLLYVTAELDQAVAAIDPKTNKILGEIPTGQADSHMVAVSHDGQRAYTANVGPGTVSVLDLVHRKTLRVIPVAGKVQRVSLSADDRWVFTADQQQPRLAVIDPEKGAVAHWVSLPGIGYGTAATPDGHSLLVAIPRQNAVAVVDLASWKVVRTLQVGSSPQKVLIRPDGKMAYASCAGSGDVAAIDLTHWQVATPIQAGKFADGLAWAAPQ